MLGSPSFISAAVAAWCRRWLGAEPLDVLFQVHHISQVTGLRLADGRKIVLKVRSPAACLHACFQVQRHLSESGFPCPHPLAGPTPLGEQLATAERFQPGGTRLSSATDSPHLFAKALAQLVALAPAPAELPPLDPPPYWMQWDHTLTGTWPADPDVDLNAEHGPAWLEEAATLVQQRLLRSSLPQVVGHVDWESQNLRWVDRRLHAVHDWDSIAARPEATIAGAAAIVFPTTGTLNEQATVGQSAHFLDAYANHRGRPFTREEQEVAWAAGLWVQAYKAKKGAITGGAERLLSGLAAESEERLHRAGIGR